ncbi:MAG: hypothetical protein KGJ59_08545 [Bacteroidota bacterium]|nr:hypothetical protein [Bacteroidota bacterium]
MKKTFAPLYLNKTRKRKQSGKKRNLKDTAIKGDGLQQIDEHLQKRDEVNLLSQNPVSLNHFKKRQIRNEEKHPSCLFSKWKKIIFSEQ